MSTSCLQTYVTLAERARSQTELLGSTELRHQCPYMVEINQDFAHGVGQGVPQKGKRKPDLVCFLKMMWITYVLLVKKKRINIIQLLKAE